MKKFVFSLLMAVVVFACMTACGVPSPPNEKQIAKDLTTDIYTVAVKSPFDPIGTDVYALDIKDITIFKRQTNEKEDTAYCVVELENEYYRFTKYVKLLYNFYDKGGWILDDWEYYDDMSYQLIGNPLEGDLVVSKFSYEYDKAELEESAFDADTGSVVFTVNVSSKHENAVVSGRLEDTYTFCGNQWIENYDSSDLSTEWNNVLGTWEYFEDHNYGEYKYGCVLVLFDNADHEIKSGGCTFYFTDGFPPYRYRPNQYFKDYSLDDAEIEISDSCITIAWDTDEYRPDVVRIGLDDASCEFVAFGYINEFESLQHIDGGEDISAYKAKYDSDDVDAWEKLIDEYFAIVETGDHEVIEDYLRKNGIFDEMDSYWGADIIDYTIDEIICSPEVYDPESIEYDYIAPFDDGAYICAVADSPNFGYVSYDFWFISRNGEWELWYIE